MYTLTELSELGIDLPGQNRELWYTVSELSEALGKVLTGNSLIKLAENGTLGKFLSLGDRTYFLRADLGRIRENLDTYFINYRRQK